MHLSVCLMGHYWQFSLWPLYWFITDMVQQACSGKLLQAWMRTFGGNILELLKSLDVEDSTDVCSKVLETLFKVSTVQDMIVSFSILDDQ